MIRIGIIGCGTIGSALTKFIVRRFRPFARLAYVSDINPAQIEELRHKIKAARFRAVSVDDLIGKSDFVIETASVAAAQQAIPKALRRGKDILVLSVGGILKIRNLTALLKKSPSKIYLPSGGIAGVDAVLAAKLGKIRSVRLTTRKPLRSLRGAPYFSRKGFRVGRVKKPTLIFEGTADEAIRDFPENVNVAVTLSLAGIGTKKTRVRVFASPTYRYNTHEIEIEGSFGRIYSQVKNVPSRDNPKTSALAIGSAVATLEKVFGQVKIGT